MKKKLKSMEKEKYRIRVLLSETMKRFGEDKMK
jgi:hypothetical protein